MELNLGDFTCLDFFGSAKDLPEIYEKKEYWLLVTWLSEKVLGKPREEAVSSVRDLPVAIMHPSPAIDEAAREYASVADALPECRQQWKRMGVNFDAPCADLCRTCPFGEGNNDPASEYGALAAIARLSNKEALTYLDGRMDFSSVENMDSTKIFCHVLERPFAYPVAKRCYEVLCDDPEGMLDEMTKLFNEGASKLEGSRFYGELSGRLEDEMRRLGIKISRELFHRGLVSFLQENVFGAAPCSELTLSIMTGEGEEDEEETADGSCPEDPPRNEEQNEGEGEPPASEGDSSPEEGGKEDDKAQAEGEDCGLEAFPYFERRGKRTTGAWFSKGERVPSVPAEKRRYLIPFERFGEGENLIVHPEISEEACADLFDVSPDSVRPEDERRRELDFLCDKVRIDGHAAVEVAWRPEREEYVLLVWNASSRRADAVTLIRRREGRLLPIPYQITQFLKSEKRRIACYQPYLLCGVLGLYGRDTEVKEVRSIFSRHAVLHSPGGRAGLTPGEVFGACEFSLGEKERGRMAARRERYGDDPFFAMLPFYGSIIDAQERYAEATCMTGALAARSAKDLMYGYSYLRCGLFPAMREAAFSLCENGHLSFREFSPGICYAPGYVMEYRFVRETEEGEGASDLAIRDNRRARQALFKELSKMRAAFYHGDLKVLYADDFVVTLYASKKCRSAHATDVSRILMHETYRYGITSNKVLASFWGVSAGEVRRIDRH